MKIYIEDGEIIETNEELVLSSIMEGFEDEYVSYEFTFNDIHGTCHHIFVKDIKKITN